MLLKISSLVLLPAILIQGYRVKKNTPRLAEPVGDRQGIHGQGTALSILILGDSAAAGVGVAHQDQALLGALLAELGDRFKIEYHLHAKTGHTTSRIYKELQQLETKHYDVVITSVGVNDVTQLRDPKEWIEQQQRLYTDIEQYLSPNLVIISGVPPMEQFPALPNPLAWLFGQYAKKMNQLLARFVQSHSHYRLIQSDITEYKKLNLEMAEDGFHPSQAIYQLWAQKIASCIQQEFKG
ncbi:SGNH/GDSL hydrolase family protein [Acinetobacter pullicarnis]|uniref:SGNH/GDSL hydrolase family protein n=1 Tax=Acinetobacter pullicarnis TaxID=2576829 RepID=UPI0011246C61|nr:SGNH/GDSL hydrolase family protein [Acinetobacter pullicarnis]